MFNLLKKPESKFNEGDLVAYNKTKCFGDENDQLFHIQIKRYGTYADVPGEQWCYTGYLLRIEESDNKGLPQMPTYGTTICNVPEDNMKGLESLIVRE